MDAILEKLLKSAQNISTDREFLLRVKLYTDKERFPTDNPFETTDECRQTIIKDIENGTIKIKEDFYKIFNRKIINCKSGEVIALIQ